MHKVITAKECVGTLNVRGASVFLILLLAGDLAFVVLHLINGFTPILETSLLNLKKDRGYSEMFQYLKFFWIIIILVFASLKNSSFLYISWVPFFVYLLLDDSLQIHERVGEHIATSLNLVPAFGLRPQDHGELVASAAAAIALALPLVWAYSIGSRVFRRVSKDIFALIIVLVFFGVVVDMMNVALGSSGTLSFVLSVVEEGGEMLAVSFILWYAFLMLVRINDTYYLCDCARIALTRRSS